MNTNILMEQERVGATLRVIREARGYTPDQFANELQISRSYLANIEGGRKRLTPPLLKKAAEALVVPQIALIRDGYFDQEQAEHEAQLQKARKERDDALKEAVRLKTTVEALEERLRSIEIPESRVLEAVNA